MSASTEPIKLCPRAQISNRLERASHWFAIHVLEAALVRRKSTSRSGLIAIEGPIASGKSDIAELLAVKGYATHLGTSNDENPFSPSAKQAFHVQLFYLLSRFRTYEKLRQGELFGRSFVVDGTFERHAIYAEHFLSGAEFGLFNKIYRALELRTTVPDLVVLLIPSPEAVLLRLRARGHPQERGLSPQAVEALCRDFFRFFRTWRRSPMLVVEAGHVDFGEDERSASWVCDEIQRAHADLQSGHRILTLAP